MEDSQLLRQKKVPALRTKLTCRPAPAIAAQSGYQRNKRYRLTKLGNGQERQDTRAQREESQAYADEINRVFIAKRYPLDLYAGLIQIV